MTARAPLLTDDSSALRELWGEEPASWLCHGSDLPPSRPGQTPRSCDGQPLLLLITGCLVPPFAVCGKWFCEFVSGLSPDPLLQALAIAFPSHVRAGAARTEGAVRFPLARVGKRPPSAGGAVPLAGRAVRSALHRQSCHGR